MTSNLRNQSSRLEHIKTARLALTAHTFDEFATFVYAPSRFARSLGLANVPAPLAPDVRDGLKMRLYATFDLDESVWETLWSVVTREENLFVGAFSFKGFPERKVAEIAYYTEEAFRNRGYMTETLRAVVDWARNRDEVSALAAETLLTNVASQRVLVKAGFQPFPDASFVDADSCAWRVDLDRAPY